MWIGFFSAGYSVYDAASHHDNLLSFWLLAGFCIGLACTVGAIINLDARCDRLATALRKRGGEPELAVRG
jgi:hypothetical protein